MKVVFASNDLDTDAEGNSKGYAAIIQCEHCSNGTVAHKPVREDILRVAFCGACLKNSAGEISPLDMSMFQ